MKPLPIGLTLSDGIPQPARANHRIPQIFLPVEIDGRHYMDAVLSEYLP